MKILELKGKKILIVGYGKEGHSTETFLKAHVPDARISITDKKDGESYLKNQQDFDIAVRSPGVPKEQIKIPYTTATNIFFANKGDREVIGVTGTKGKSTTAALIHRILSNSDKRSKLIGNIGTPMLDSLLTEPQLETIFIFTTQNLLNFLNGKRKQKPPLFLIVLFKYHLKYY